MKQKSGSAASSGSGGGGVSKSGNSLVIRIPQEIAKSMKLKRGLPIIIYPSDKDRLVVEVES